MYVSFGRQFHASGTTCRRHRRAIALLIGLIACLAVVWQSSRGAFTGTTRNDSNTLGAGTVSITDSDVGTTMITQTNLAPGGPPQTACIGVQYTGSLTPSAIKVYAGSAEERNTAAGGWVAWTNTATSELDDYLNLQIEVNDTDMNAAPTSLTDCTPTGYNAYNATPVLTGATGSLKSFINSGSSFASGLPSQWGTITANKWRVFKFTYSLAATAPDSAQGDGVRFNVVWEAQS
jgi:hypothetical protein